MGGEGGTRTRLCFESRPLHTNAVLLTFSPRQPEAVLSTENKLLGALDPARELDPAAYHDKAQRNDGKNAKVEVATPRTDHRFPLDDLDISGKMCS